MRLSKTNPSIKNTANKIPKPPPTPLQRRRRRTRIIVTSAISLFAALCVAAGIYIYHVSRQPLKVSPDEIVFESKGGQAMINVSGPGEWSVSAKNKSWRYYSQTENGVMITVDENDNLARRDTIFIKGKNNEQRIVIKQESGAFYASPTNKSTTVYGGTLLFKINGQNDWHIATQPDYWGHAYRDKDYLVWEVDESNMSEPRNDFITLQSGNKEIILSIYQDGRLTAAENFINVSSSATTRRIKIKGFDNWTASSNDYDVSVSRDGDNLVVRFEKNDDDYPREGSIFVKGGGQTITIEYKQSAKSSGGSYYYNPYPFYW